MTTAKLKWNGDEVILQGKKVIGQSMFGIGLVVEGYAKLTAPVKTGRLAASITTQSRTDGTTPSGQGAVASDIIDKPRDDNEVLVGTPVVYAPYMEFGTIRTNAQAFLRPSLRLAQGQALSIVRKDSKFYWKDYLK